MQKRPNSIANTLKLGLFCIKPLINGLLQKRRNSIANALELRLFCY